MLFFFVFVFLFFFSNRTSREEEPVLGRWKSHYETSMQADHANSGAVHSPVFLFFFKFILKVLLFSAAVNKKIQQPHGVPSIWAHTAGSGSVLSRGWASALVPRQRLISGVSSARWWVRTSPSAASYGVHELVHQSLRHIRFADDALLVVLPYGAAKLVIVHGGAILSEPPQPGDVGRVFDFENAWWKRNRYDIFQGHATKYTKLHMMACEEQC